MSLLALQRITQPATEPITLATVKQWLRVDTGFTADDALISGLIIAARERVEDHLGRSLVSQQWQLNLDFWPSYRPCDTAPGRANSYGSTGGYWWDSQAIFLPRPPVISIDSIQYIAMDGTTQTMAADSYIFDQASEPCRLLPAYNAYWPVALMVPNAITIKYTCGYATIPQTFLLAMQLMISAWYENPSDFSIGAGAATTIPLNAQRLLQSQRVSFDYSVR